MLANVASVIMEVNGMRKRDRYKQNQQRNLVVLLATACRQILHLS